jgi:hypothetical protein
MVQQPVYRNQYKHWTTGWPTDGSYCLPVPDRLCGQQRTAVSCYSRFLHYR